MRWTGAVALLLFAATAQAQDALVLGGGGSRGLAHAGALAGLERQGYQPEIVVGTSIGAIIGALYAAGFSADSIRALVRSEDWQELFAPPRWAVGPEWDARRPMLRLGVGIDRRRYTDGLITDVRVNRALVRLLFDPAARARGDFDQLPRRYRSMTTDLRTGDPVVLASGDLARAVRASMAVPGVFAPIYWDSTWLVDGGIADYLPVGPAREAGAKRVVAIDVVQPPSDTIELFPLQVMIRGFRLTLDNARPRDVRPDVLVAPLIDPDLAGAVFLRDPTGLFDTGFQAAMLQAPSFGPLEPPPQPRAPPARISSLAIESNDPRLEPLVRREFQTVVGPYNPNRVLDAAERLYATGLFDGIWPRAEPDPNDEGAIRLVVLADASAPRALMGAAGYDNDRSFRAWLALEQRIGTADLSLALSANSLDRFLALSYSRPIRALLPTALAAGAAWTERDLRAFDADGDITGESEFTRIGGWIGLTAEPLGRGPSFRLALRADHLDNNQVSGTAAGPALRIAAAEPASRIVGGPTLLDLEWRLGDVEYRRARVSGSIAETDGALLLAATGSFETASTGAPADAVAALGDDYGFPGLRFGEGRGLTRALAGFDMALATPLEAFLTLRVRTGAATLRPADLPDARWLTGAELGLGWWTPLGRLSFDVGTNTGGGWRFRVDVGQRF